MILNGENLNLENTWRVAKGSEPVEFCSQARQKMLRSRQYIEEKMNSGDVIYGVNTGFGLFSDVQISQKDIKKLQINLIRSHCSGVGEPFSKEQTKAVMFLRANALARGHSGVRPQVVEKILEFLNNDVIPKVPQQGSVGASGDLAPLAHLALSLIGEGEVWAEGDVRGEDASAGGENNRGASCFVATEKALKTKDLQPLTLEAKEGLSLINGCQVMTGVGMLGAFEAQRLMVLADLAGAMSLEALRGSRSAFDSLIFETRAHPGEAVTAKNLLKALGPRSEIGDSHAHCSRVQDPYSLRCMPAVHGAAKDLLRRGVETLEVEANASTDNPLVFAEEDKVLSCGNFHGEPVALTLDSLCMAVNSLGSISERRIEKLINPNLSQLPAFLIKEGGLNSGMMIVQVAASSLVSENKVLSHPASVDSVPTSAEKEDHVSMGTIAARKFEKVVRNVEYIIAMELLAAAQGLDFLAPLKPTAGVLAVHQCLRQRIPFAEEDRVFANDIETVVSMIRSNEILEAATESVGELQC